MSETVYLGVDLGTSRTSVTSSTGVRETVWSYVGYPKDHVARKKFGGRDVVFGKEAVDNRMSLDLIRPLAGGSIKVRGARDSQKTKQALRDLVEHVVGLTKTPAGSTVFAVIGAPAEASVEGKAAIVDAASGSLSPTGWISSTTRLSSTSAPEPRTSVVFTAPCRGRRISVLMRSLATRSIRPSPG